MGFLKDLEDLLTISKEKAEQFMVDSDHIFTIEKTIKGIDNNNTLYCCDNIYSMIHLLKEGFEGKIDLVYIDPPFFTNANYYKKVSIDIDGKKKDFEVEAYGDKWEDKIDFIKMMAIRLQLIKKLLSDKGTIYLHLDQRMVHHLRLVMDYIFGEDNFINEIIWSYKSGGSTKRRFSRKHDNILVYSKTKDYIFNPQSEKSYNRGFKPYRFKNVQEFQDEIGWHTMVNMKDVWTIDMVGRTSGERVGYDTQKPYNLIKRAILSSSNENSIVADFFLGSGTTIKVADDFNRSWIGSDIEPISINTTKRRLLDSQTSFNVNFIEKTSIEDDSNLIIDSKWEADELGISLIEYKLSNPAKTKSSRDLEGFKSLMEENSLELIDYISIIGVENKSELLFEQFKPHIGKDRIVLRNLDYYKEVYLRGFDIFGNMFKVVLKGGK